MTRWTEQDGATAVEYGIIAGVVGLVFVAAGPMLWHAMLTLLDVVLDSVVG